MHSNKLITLMAGANQGLGFETAKNLLEDEIYHVVPGCRDLSKGEAAAQTLSAQPNLKGTVSAVELDVTDEGSIDAAAAHLMSLYGRLDILVNNAGIFLRGNPREVAHDLFRTNVIGYVSVTEAFLPLLREAPAPRIVCLTSSLGSFALASDPKSPLYAPLANEYRAASAARNMLVNQLWVRLQIENPGLFKVHGADPGLVATNLAGSPDALRKRGAVEADVGGARIASIVKGEQDAHVGRVCSEGSVVPW